MKFSTLATLVAATVSVASASPSIHGHARFHKRDVATAVEEAAPGATVVLYELNGHYISLQEVQEGLKNGSLILAPGGVIAPAPAAAPTPAPVKDAAVNKAAVAAPVAPVAAAAVAAAIPAKAPVPAAKPSTNLSGSGVDAAFPDGQLDCSDFPDQFGAVALPYLGLGGWSGIQLPGSNIGGFSDIMTVTSGLCNGVGCCKEGAFCSYACPAGFQKSQWPVMQGLTGQSVGGIQCRGGKLWLTNSASNKLCMSGTDKVDISIVNKMSTNSAVCRTDYPGNEGETIPLDAQPGTTTALTCPAADNYYIWEGKSTSAQYYVNPKGVSVEDGCQWGTSANPWGNFAPINLGVGYSDGSAWLSIFPNKPTTDAVLDFNIEITGDNMLGRCKLVGGVFYSGVNYETQSPTGCTVNVLSGKASYVFSS